MLAYTIYVPASDTGAEENVITVFLVVSASVPQSSMQMNRMFYP